MSVELNLPSHLKFNSSNLPDEPYYANDAEGLQIFIRRYDLIHSEISGNKLFKLEGWWKNYTGQEYVLSFGGAYSNHLLALSAWCKALNVKSIGAIRGEEPKQKSTRLLQMEANGMHLEFISRADYRLKSNEEFVKRYTDKWGQVFVIPEGGSGLPGIAGAMEMVNENENYDLIAIAAGTGTSVAGLALKAKGKDVWGFQVLKGENMLRNELSKLMVLPENLTIFETYSYGGYAKFPEEVEAFYKEFSIKQGFALDKVYGVKAFLGLLSELKKQHLHSNKVLFIHSGGL